MVRLFSPVKLLVYYDFLYVCRSIGINGYYFFLSTSLQTSGRSIFWCFPHERGVEEQHGSSHIDVRYCTLLTSRNENADVGHKREGHKDRTGSNRPPSLHTFYTPPPKEWQKCVTNSWLMPHSQKLLTQNAVTFEPTTVLLALLFLTPRNEHLIFALPKSSFSVTTCTNHHHPAALADGRKAKMRMQLLFMGEDSGATLQSN